MTQTQDPAALSSSIGTLHTLGTESPAIPLQSTRRDHPMNHPIRWAMAVAALLAFEVSAQPFVYPAKGQTPATQKADEKACHSWAVQQTGFDPTKPPPATAAPAAPPTTATGTQPGAGVRGAARGAVVGEVVSGDAGAGAAVGAAAARGQSRKQNAAAVQSSQQQQQAAQQQQQASYAKACTACLEGKGYTVK